VGEDHLGTVGSLRRLLADGKPRPDAPAGVAGEQRRAAVEEPDAREFRVVAGRSWMRSARLGFSMFRASYRRRRPLRHTA